jgi:hypothetical protein
MGGKQLPWRVMGLLFTPFLNSRLRFYLLVSALLALAVGQARAQVHQHPPPTPRCQCADFGLSCAGRVQTVAERAAELAAQAGMSVDQRARSTDLNVCIWHGVLGASTLLASVQQKLGCALPSLQRLAQLMCCRSRLVTWQQCAMTTWPRATSRTLALSSPISLWGVVSRASLPRRTWPRMSGRWPLL